MQVRAVLPEEEAGWLLRQRSSAVAIISRVRLIFHQQFAAGHLGSHLQYKLETNLLELYQVSTRRRMYKVRSDQIRSDQIRSDQIRCTRRRI